MFSHRTRLCLALIFALPFLPLANARAAAQQAQGGTINGTITDPKGAVVVGASVVVLDATGNEARITTTDQKGHYKMEGLAEGSYTLTVRAKGFSDARVEAVKVEEGKTITTDVHLEVAPVEVVTTVNASEKPGNNDPVYQQLRHNSDSPNAFGGSYAVGPVTQGYRLSNAKTGAAYQFLVYPKGAFILHMLRMMMYDPNKGGDARFQVLMNDFVKTHFNQDVTTEDFKRITEKHMTPQMDLDGNGHMDWFFNEWVYGTEIPSYRFEYSINSNGGQATLAGRITQSGVSDNFRMKVPVYVDFGKGWVRLGSASITGNSSVDLPNIPLPQTPKRAAICALDDVLALSIDNVKR